MTATPWWHTDRGRSWHRETRRHPWAVGVGVLWALAFPTPGIAGLAWVAPGALLACGLGLGRWEVFRVGYVAGLVQSLVSLRWLLEMPHALGAAVAWLALCGYCALFPGLWLMLAVRLLEVRSGLVGRGPFGWRPTLERYATTPWFRRATIPAAIAASWVGVEFLRGWLFTGFPWNQLGTSQWRQVPLLQITRVAGVEGLSFLVCWVSTAMATGCLLVVSRPRDRWMWLAEARLPLFGMLACLGWGFYGIIEQRREEFRQPGREIRLALVQPSIPQTLLWKPDEQSRTFGVLRELTRSALATRPDLLVWPEGDFGLDRERFRAVLADMGESVIPWIFSGVDAEEGGRVAYNAAFLAGADGRVTQVYRKRRRVPFGEYVPLEQWLPFLRHLTPIGEGFAAGAMPVAFEVPTAQGKVGAAPVICFEDTFGRTVREHAGEGVDFLLELTNDGWFGRSAAQWQHLANVVCRTVENDIPLVRCANNGVTCWVDRLGVVRETLGAPGAGVYERGFLSVSIPVGRERNLGTGYRRHGDVLGWICAAWVLFQGALNLRVGRRGLEAGLDRARDPGPPQ